MRCELYGAYTDLAKRFNRMRSPALRALISLTLFFSIAIPAKVNSATSAPTPVKIAIALEVGGVGDNSFNDAVVSAVRAVQKKYKISDSYIRVIPTDGTTADRIARLKFLAKAGYNLIIAIGADYATAIDKISKDFPDIQYALVNSKSVGALNVSCLVFAEQEEAFLAGVVAASSSKTLKVAFISDDSDPQKILFNSFRLGAIYGNKKVKAISVPFIDSPVDLNNAIKNGVDLIYSTRIIDGQVLDLVAKVNSKKNGKVWLIAQSPDQYFLKLPAANKEILVTLDKRIDRAIADVMALSISGGSILDIVDDENSIYGRTYNFKNSGLTLTYLNPVTAATKSKVTRAISEIKSGKVSTQG